MTPEKINYAGNPDRMDAMLDTALAQYSAAEARVGLEERILTNLRLSERPLRRLGWRTVAVTAAIVLLAIPSYLEWRGMITGSHRDKGEILHGVFAPAAPADLHPQPPPPARNDSSVQRRDAHANSLLAAGQPKRPLGAGQSAYQSRPPSVAKSVAGPRLEQFPAASPLTEQEILLSRYAREVEQAASAEPPSLKDLEVEALNVAPLMTDQPEK